MWRTGSSFNNKPAMLYRKYNANISLKLSAFNSIFFIKARKNNNLKNKGFLYIRRRMWNINQFLLSSVQVHFTVISGVKVEMGKCHARK